MANSEFREKLLKGLGGDWPKQFDLQPRSLEAPLQKEGYRIEKISYAPEEGDRIPAYLLIPDGVNPQHPAPAVAVWHQHAGAYTVGKVEPAGIAGKPMHHTGVALARQGFVVLCPDALVFGERQDPTQKLKGGDYERFQFLRYVVEGKCLAWKNILDMKRGIDYLVSRPEVKGDKIGCYGHSMGATHSYLVAPWEERIRCVVTNCCMPTYRGIHREHLLHCFPNFVPGIFPEADTPDIVALIAPRPLHMNFGELDNGSPIDEVRRGMEIVQQAYARQNAGDKFSFFIEPKTGHVLSETMWQHVVRVFRQNLL